MTNLQSTVTRSFVFTELFGAFYQTDILKLTLKFLLNGITKETMTNLQNTVKRHGISFSASILLPIITVTFWRCYCEIRAKPHRGLKNGQFPKHCHRPFIYRFSLVYLCVSCKKHFGVLTVKFLLNQKYES